MRTYNKINESKYINKVIAHIENDPLDSRLELKKIYSLSTDEYFELLDYEVNLINSLQGEIFDTSDPKWVGTGNYEFTFEVDRAYIIDNAIKDDYSLFKGDIIDVNVNIDRGGTVYLFDPERESSIGEAVSDDNIGYIVESEINDIIYRILEQRLPELKNFNTFNVIDTILYMVDLDNKNNISEGVYKTSDGQDLYDYVYNDLIENTKWENASYSSIDVFDCKSINTMISWGSVSPYFLTVPECLEKFLMNTYGLNWGEVENLFFNRYEKYVIDMALSKGKRSVVPRNVRDLDLPYLNESVDNKFLDKVVNNLIYETKPTSEKHVSVITPFNHFHGGVGYWVLSAHRCREIGITHPENYMIPEIISNHLRDVYSLRSIKEMEYVMNKYYFNIYNKYFRKFFDNEKRVKISESEDLEYNKSYWEKENQFFVKIVNQIMRETVTDYKNNVIKFPFDSELVIGPLFFSDINNILDSNINNLSGVFPYNLYDHCKDVYGLKYNEIKRLWTLYSAELIKHILKVWDKEWVDYQISDQGTMGTLLPESTKSVGDNSEFLNKIVDYMVDTTELVEIPHHPNIRIKYPFIDYGSTNKIPHMWYEAVPKVIFIVGMMENYGLNGEEAHFVLDKYKEKLRNKVKTKLPNE